MRRSWLAILAVVVLLVGALGSASASPSSAPSDGPAVIGLAAGPIPTPTGPHPATIYSVRNLDTQALSVRQTFVSDAGAQVYEFTDSLAIGQTKTYHVLNMSQIPDPFSGSVTFTVDNYITDPPIEALVTGYDTIPFVDVLPVIRR